MQKFDDRLSTLQLRAGQSGLSFVRWCQAALLLACGLALASGAQAARLALVVGNASYTERPLKNPVNDATDLKKALEDAGFQVTLVLEANADKMKEAIAEFGDRLARENDVGLFYFSGHGVQTPKGNYLLPVGRSFQRERDVELFAVEARAVLDQMARARNPLNIVILDACRDSPLPATERSAGSKGLARMDAPSGSVIAFATAPGRTASDNSSGRNGLYTKHLINALSTEGLTLEAVFRRVGAAVERDNPDQSPEEVMKLRSEAPFYFRPPRGTPPDREYEQWAAASRANTAAAYSEYLSAYPAGRYVTEARKALAEMQANHLVPSRLVNGQLVKDCAECPDLVVIPAGEYLMGSRIQAAESFKVEWPQHRVAVDRFLAGRYEVTFEEWDACVAAGGCSFRPSDEGWGRGRRPVINVSWNDARQYVRWLALKTGKPYRLLSEAEWEYVARASTSTPFWWGDRPSRDRANYGADTCCAGEVSGRDQWMNTAPVGSFHANSFGLYDTSGNVWEWVEDTWQEDYGAAPSDGSAWVRNNEVRRVLRGGSWINDGRLQRSAVRNRSDAGSRNFVVGFRVARSIEPSEVVGNRNDFPQ